MLILIMIGMMIIILIEAKLTTKQTCLQTSNQVYSVVSLRALFEDFFLQSRIVNSRRTFRRIVEDVLALALRLVNL